MAALVLEVSTASAKAMVFSSEEKRVLAMRSLAYPPSVGDVCTQEADGVLEAALSVGRQAAEGHDITAVAVVGAWHTLLLCNRRMEPLGKAYTWAYVGASGTAAALRRDEEFTQYVYETTGCMVHALYPAVKLFHFKEKGMLPDNCLFTELGSYVFFRLTGERLSTACLWSGSGFFSYQTQDIDQLLLARLGLSRAQFGTLATHEDVSPLSESMARRLGIKAGLPVVPAMADGAMNQVGSGALSSGLMTVSVGTSAALRLSYDRPRMSPARETWCYRAPGKYLCGAATQGATSSVDWFAKGMLANQYSYRELDKTARPSEDAPVFLPFLFGERCPGWRDDRQGGFLGVSGRHTYQDLYYALLEGVLMNIRQCYQALCRLTGPPLEIRVSGGILHSPVWTQMLADILGQALMTSENEQASMLGGAILALHAAGDWPDIAKGPAPGRRVTPDAQKRAFYEARYRRYLDVYENLP